MECWQTRRSNRSSLTVAGGQRVKLTSWRFVAHSFIRPFTHLPLRPALLLLLLFFALSSSASFPSIVAAARGLVVDSSAPLLLLRRSPPGGPPSPVPRAGAIVVVRISAAAPPPGGGGAAPRLPKGNQGGPHPVQFRAQRIPPLPPRVRPPQPRSHVPHGPDGECHGRLGLGASVRIQSTPGGGGGGAVAPPAIIVLAIVAERRPTAFFLLGRRSGRRRRRFVAISSIRPFLLEMPIARMSSCGGGG